jgi:hypothetical protein
MPVVQTQGFHVGNMPQVQLADPRSLAPSYGSLIPAVNQGLATYGNLQQIADEAKARPVKQQMAQIQLARLAEIQQNAAVPQQIIEGIDITGGDVRKSIVDPGVPFEQIQITEDIAPRVKTITGIDIGPGGVKTPFTKRETLASGQQVKAEREKADLARRSTEALAASRERGKVYEYEVLAQREQEARGSGDDELADLLKARLTRLTATTGIGEFVTGARELEKMAARIGIPVEKAALIAASPEGARYIAKMDSIKKYVAASGSSYIPAHMKPTAQEEAAVQAILGGAPVVTTGAGGYPSADAVKAAVRSGTLTKEAAIKILRDQFGFK